MEKGKIPVFRLSFDEAFRKRFREYCDQILNEAFLSNHRLVQELESRFASFSGSSVAVATCHGTAALELAFRLCDVQGREVILPSNTFIATASAILAAGGIPVPVDIESDYFGACPRAIEAAITPRTAAIAVVHVGGLISPSVLEVERLCRARAIPLVEDCAHAHGSTLAGRQAGQFGEVAAYSFFTTKVMTTGEGGMLTLPEPGFTPRRLERAKSLRQFGRIADAPLTHAEASSNSKMSELSAALGLCELERLGARIEKRRLVAERYQSNLRGTGWRAVAAPSEGTCSYYKQIVLPPPGVERARIASHLQDREIALTGGVYAIPLHRQPVFQSRFDDAAFPVANLFSESHICPPCYPELEFEEADRVCEALLELRPS